MFWVSPSDQGFEACGFAGLQIDDGFVDEVKLFLDKCVLQVLLQADALDEFVLHLLVEEDVSRLAVLFGDIQGAVGIAEYVFSYFVFTVIDRDTDACGRSDFLAGDVVRLFEDIEKSSCDNKRIFFAVDAVEQDDEFITTESSREAGPCGCAEHVAVAQVFVKSRSDTDEQLITGLVAECVVDVFKAVEV